MVLLRKLNNADAGTSTTLGGNDTDKLADYYNNVDVSETPTINTDTRYRSGKLSLRDGSNAFNIVLKSATQTADRDWTLPALIGNDSPATLGLANVFTNVNQITFDADTLFNLYRPVSTTNSLNSIAFFHRNSSNASVKYASMASQVITNTNALEDGKLKFFVKKAGVDTEVMSIDKDGVVTAATFSGGVGGGAGLSANTFTGVQTISVNNALPLLLYRPANTTTNLVGLDFQQNNASSAAKSYGRISTEIVTNTAAAEDGKMHFYVMKAGTLTDVMNVDKNGLLTVTSISTGGAVTSTILKNSGAQTTTASSSTEFDLLNYSVAANQLGANGSLKIILEGYILQNQATATDFTWRIKFGGTTVYQDAQLGLVQQPERRVFRLQMEYGNRNSTSAQNGIGILSVNDTSPAPTTGDGSIQDDESHANNSFKTTDTALATNVSRTIQITMQHSVNNANVATTVTRQIIEFIPGV